MKLNNQNCLCRKPTTRRKTLKMLIPKENPKSRFLHHRQHSRSLHHHQRPRSLHHRQRSHSSPSFGSPKNFETSRIGFSTSPFGIALVCSILKTLCLWMVFNLRSRIRYSISIVTWSSSWSALRHSFETSICTSNSHFRSKLQHLIAMDSHSIELDFWFWIASSSSTSRSLQHSAIWSIACMRDFYSNNSIKANADTYRIEATRWFWGWQVSASPWLSLLACIVNCCDWSSIGIGSLKNLGGSANRCCLLLLFLFDFFFVQLFDCYCELFQCESCELYHHWRWGAEAAERMRIDDDV